MSKEVIAVDIDEVLSPMHDLIFAHHNAVYSTNYQSRDPSGKYYIDQFTGDDYTVTKQKFRKFIDTPEFQNVRPLEGAVKAIKQLSNRYTLIIITARQDFFEEFTREWLQRHFPDRFKSVHFAEYVTGVGIKVPKLQFCREHDVRYIIDDNLSTVHECATGGIEALLFGDYPWNTADKLPATVTRCTDWNEVLEYFDERS